MDYILFNSDGSIKARNLTDYIQKGNDGVNSIFVSVAGIESADLDDYTCSANFLLPDDDVVATLPTQVTSADPVTIGGSDYVGWLVPIDAQVTQYEGQVKFSLVITDVIANPNTVLLTFNAYLTINPSVLDPDEVNISATLYNELLAAIQGRVPKSTVPNKVYGTDSNGDQYNYGVDSDELVFGSIPLRRNGQLKVPNNPLADSDATSKKYVGDNFLKVHTFDGTATFADIYDECGTNPFTLIYNNVAYYAHILSEGPSGYYGLKIVNGERYGYYVGPGTYTLSDFRNYRTHSFVRNLTASFSDTLQSVFQRIEVSTPFFLKVYDYGNNARSYLGCIRSSATKYYFEFEEVGTYATGGDDTSILETPKYRYVGAVSDVTTTLSSIFGLTYRQDYALASEIKKLYKHHIIHFKENNGNFSGADYYADIVSPSPTPVTVKPQLDVLLRKNISFTPFYLWGGAIVIGYFTPCSNTNALSPNDLENAFDDCNFVLNNDFSDTVTELQEESQ